MTHFDYKFIIIVKLIVFRVPFIIAVYYDLNINQINVKMTFLYKIIDQQVYIQISKNLGINANKKMICKLSKTLYSLKQALKLWYKKLFKFLFKKLGLKQINTDYSIFVTLADINCLIISTFFDDIKIMGIKIFGHIEKVKQKLVATFKMVDIGSISFYLNLKIEKNCQKKTLKLF